MEIDARAAAWVKLQCWGVPPRALVGLLRAFGDPEAVLAASVAARERHLPAGTSGRIDVDRGRFDTALAWLEQADHALVAWGDAEYPPALLDTTGPPPVLYTVGQRGLLARPALAIVGSRNATPQGCHDAEAFAQALGAAGLAIVSGLAVGIDAAAHRGALASGAGTIAVVGTGPDRIYPASNASLAHRIAAEGLIVSEFTPGTPPLKANFPRRNRVISGLARGVLVIEATLSSGSLITARLAGEQGREVFALPGSIHSPFARGCHKLIREGAKLVETAQDVLEELRFNADVSAHSRPVAPRAPDLLPANESQASVLAALGHELLDVDALSARTQLPAAKVTAALSTLELDGRVAPLDGGRWQRLG